MHNLFATILQFGSDLLPVRSDALIDGRAAGLYNWPGKSTWSGGTAVAMKYGKASSC